MIEGRFWRQRNKFCEAAQNLKVERAFGVHKPSKCQAALPWENSERDREGKRKKTKQGQVKPPLRSVEATGEDRYRPHSSKKSMRSWRATEVGNRIKRGEKMWGRRRAERGGVRQAWRAGGWMGGRTERRTTRETGEKKINVPCNR